jgi:hypothetical protein
MGIFKKIFDWTSLQAPADIDENRRTASQTLPTPAVSVPGLAAMNSNVPGSLPYLLENSSTPSVATQNRNLAQDPFTAHPNWGKERTQGLECTGLDGLPSPEEGFLDQVVNAFDEAFDAACRSAMPTHSISVAGSLQNDGDEATVQHLFAQIAANHSQPLRNFVFELRCGTASKDRIEFLRPSLQMIDDAAAKMGLAEAAERIKNFDEVLSMVQARPERLLECETRVLILDSYNEMSEALPEVFRRGEDEQKREDIIIKSLLRQIPGAGCVTFDKLYKAGIGSLEALFLANTADLAAVTSIPVPLCERIADKFQEYHAEALAISHHDPQSSHRARLTSLVAELRCRHEELESTSVGAALNAGLATERRRRRQLRQQCFLQIIATLAELGEVDLINKIQRLSFRQRLKRLGDHLETLDGEARRPPMHSAELLSQR